MEQQPRKRRGALIFSLVFLAVAGAIAATVLLANDRRNLNVLLRELGVETRTMVIPKPGTMEAFKGKRLQGVAVLLPENTFAPPVKTRESAFMRSMQKSGEALCQLFRKEGFDMTPWAASSLSQQVFECSNETTLPNAADARNPSTFFLIVKGTADGHLLSTRAKLIFSEADQRPPLAAGAARMLALFGTYANWLDLAEEAPKVASLTTFSLSNFGISVKFSREFSGEGRYNLIIAPSSPLQPAQQRTRDFFTRKNYWPLLPEHGGPPIKAAEETPEG
ncbi:hypothetical protein IHQ71_03605 [Rhizobium sp. TH2]|uniref:DUF6030 family protein n=1 Tax=Rhizobium sp. TH2 TaxID=2775403 RepID=UPI0021570693|nr:DUF6030 family protein [Rhizobium sp. TH2]UVC09716.1 hypothetical protein IHQ71_03605 [Rhizobium sp. TH2]